jgi:poly-gamma-glutamate capsule biosynthesis protein CapA/YwtB (metallophosphatase superfamily)
MIRICAVGDVCFQGSVLVTNTIFSEIFSIVFNCDIAIANLENPLTTRDHGVDGKCTLQGSPEWAKILKDTGFNIVSLANNHIMDYGPEGLFDTIRSLDSVGILHVGAGKNIEEARAPLFMQVKGKSLAIFARSSVIVSSPSYAGPTTPGVAFLEASELIERIKAIRSQVDLIILFLHWGIEEYSYPSPSQVKLAREFVEAGADAIIGHHPHVLQGVQRVGKALVAYSLGNFLFNNFRWMKDTENADILYELSEANRKGMILQLDWSGNSNIGYSAVFTRIDANGHIQVESDNYNNRILLGNLSKVYKSFFYSFWWRLYSFRMEWNIRLKARFSLHNIVINFHKLRPRHFKEALLSLKRSVKISIGKTTNPYE